MPEASYSIEYAKSGRSKCKKCKEPINKGDMRLCVSVPASDDRGFDMSSYHHVECFRLPRKFATGATKMSPEEFLEEMVTDETGKILPAKLEELAQKMAESSTSSSSAQKKKKENSEDKTLMGRIKEAAEETSTSSDNERPKKKAKKGVKDDEDDDFDRLVAAYKRRHKTKGDNLKDFLKWNRQVMSGHKDFVLFKVIDGEVNGRLGVCPLDGGRLKFQEGDEVYVHCNGRFDEDVQVRIPCEFKGERLDPKLRLQPWYTTEPTDEEKEAMDKLIEAGRGEGEQQPSETDAAKEILSKAENMDWKLNDKAGIKKASAELVDLVSGKLDLPEGKDLTRLLGPMIVSNSDKTPKEIVEMVVKKYGFKEDKERKVAAKEAALESACANPKNAPLLLAFQELSQLYFKESNRNAGLTYSKVVDAIKGLDMEITAGNAMSLCKGKTKVPGIGKGSAEKMKEFMETGTMQKLEEKRADQA